MKAEMDLCHCLYACLHKGLSFIVCCQREEFIYRAIVQKAEAQAKRSGKRQMKIGVEATSK